MSKPYSLYTFQTPNGWKAAVTMEELGLDYNLEVPDLFKGEHKQDWFLKINPNGRIPALVDHSNGDQRVFETGAIMWYLCEKEKSGSELWPQDLSKRAEIMSWLMFQMGGVGPMQGQANHFITYAPEKIAYAMKRYVDETRRLYDVLESRLKDHEWLAGDSYSLADIANFCWVFIGPWAGIDWREWPGLKAWVERISQRPAVQRGLRIPVETDFLKIFTDEDHFQKLMADAAASRQQAESVGKS